MLIYRAFRIDIDVLILCNQYVSGVLVDDKKLSSGADVRGWNSKKKKKKKILVIFPLLLLFYFPYFAQCCLCMLNCVKQSKMYRGIGNSHPHSLSFLFIKWNLLCFLNRPKKYSGSSLFKCYVRYFHSIVEPLKQIMFSLLHDQQSKVNLSKKKKKKQTNKARWKQTNLRRCFTQESKSLIGTLLMV